MKKASLLFILVTAFLFSKSQTYIPEQATNKQQASCVFSYSFKSGANRPSASIVFKDGFEFYLNAVCSETGEDGTDYDWCVRNSDMEEVAFMSVRFYASNSKAEIKILQNEKSKNYLKYLNSFKGYFRRIGK